MAERFRVLSLNGGGIKGLYAAALLARVEQSIGKRLIDHFDLIVGTSTGGLIALALALEQSAESIRDFYQEHGATIFPSGGWTRRRLFVRNFWRAKHDPSVLQSLVQKQFGESTLLGAARRPLVINTFKAAHGVPSCFKTRHHRDFVRDHKIPAWEVAMATSAAPVFYPAFESPTGTDYIDGGVWANCPVLVGAVEAIDRFGRDRTGIDILSVGTTRPSFQVRPQARRGGMLQNRDVHELLMESSRCAAMFMAKRLLGPDSILEADRVVAPKQFQMDDARRAKLRDLATLGTEDADQLLPRIAERFLRQPAAPWEPVDAGEPS